MSADGYAVVMEGGWFVGIWKDQETAELVAGKHPKGEVRAMAYLSEKRLPPELTMSMFANEVDYCKATAEGRLLRIDALERELAEAQNDYSAMSCKFTDMERRCLAAEATLLARNAGGEGNG